MLLMDVTANTNSTKLLSTYKAQSHNINKVLCVVFSSPFVHVYRLNPDQKEILCCHIAILLYVYVNNSFVEFALGVSSVSGFYLYPLLLSCYFLLLDFPSTYFHLSRLKFDL